MKKDRGFTLIELMITVAVGAILMAIAVPNFVGLIQDTQTSSQANELLRSLVVARDEAMHRQKAVNFAPASGTSYSSGWTISTSNNDGTSYTLRQHEAVEQLAEGPAGSITFNSLGQASSTVLAPFVFQLRPPNCASGDRRQRTLSVAVTGRSSISVTPCP